MLTVTVPTGALAFVAKLTDKLSPAAMLTVVIELAALLLLVKVLTPSAVVNVASWVVGLVALS